MTSVDTASVMVTDVDQLAEALGPMAEEFPDIHHQLVTAMAGTMGPGGVVEFTLSELAKTSRVRLSLVKDYVRAARENKVLQLLGRRTDNGRIRYCAYRPGGNTMGNQP